jgi:hypothetical protein
MPVMLRPTITTAAIALTLAPALARQPVFQTSVPLIPLEHPVAATLRIDADQDGLDDLAVLYAGAGLQIFRTRPNALPEPTPLFTDTITYIEDSVVTDMDADGLPDLVFLNHSIEILLNAPGVNYARAPKSPYPLPSPNTSFSSIDAIDLDNDNLPELLLSGTYPGVVAYPNPGEGLLGLPFVLIPDINAADLVVADLKGTGTPQIIVMHGTNGRTATVHERVGDAWLPVLTIANNTDCFSAAATDPDANARQRVIITNRNATGATVLAYDPVNDSLARVKSGSDSGSVSSGTSIAFGDLNNDALPDIVRGTNDAISTLGRISSIDQPGRYDTLQSPGHFGGLHNPAVLDFNGDGLSDIVFTLTSPNSLAVFDQHPDGGFAHLAAAAQLGSFRFDDLPTPAAEPDAQAAFLQTTISQNTAAARVSIIPDAVGHRFVETAIPSVTGIASSTRWITGDLNADSIPDIASVRLGTEGRTDNPDQLSLGFQAGLQDETYAPRVSIPFTGVWDTTRPVIADFNNDTVADLAVLDTVGRLFMFRGNPGSEPSIPTEFQLVPPRVITSDPAAGALLTADLDLDGHADLIAGDRGGIAANLFIAYGRGDGTFESPAQIPTLPGAGGRIGAYHLTARINDDAYPDILMATASRVAVHLSAGPRAFHPHTTILETSSISAVVAADLDADGRDEILTSIYARALITRFGPQGQPIEQSISLAPESASDIRLQDLDADGRPDLIFTSTQGISILYNRTNTPVPCPADINADGLLNFFDVAAYIALYNASDPAADLAAPFGTLNFFDLAAYIALYNAGCP